MTEIQKFGKHVLHATDIFFRSSLSFGFVNLKPIIPGHVLVSPKRIVPRFADMTTEEVQDLFLAVHKIGPILQQVYGGTSLTIAIQDGADAGQSVEHVHVHVISRKKGDFARNDDIYEKIHTWNKIDDASRRPRTVAEMAQEAATLRSFLNRQ